MGILKQKIYKSLVSNKVGKFILNKNFNTRFPAASDYWENRYRKNGTSGPGSYGELALYKAAIINKFIMENRVAKVIEFGCGDGNQLQYLQAPAYIGLDVSATAVSKCIHLFKNDASKSFFIYHPAGFRDCSAIFRAPLTLSLDVIYHLTEDDVFESYMHHLFSSSAQFVIIYAWDVELPKSLHIKHRKFTAWIGNNMKEWHLWQTIQNESTAAACDFYIYRKDLQINL